PSFLRTLAATAREARIAARTAPPGGARKTPEEDLNDLADALDEVRASIRSLAAAVRAAEQPAEEVRDEGAAALVELYELAGSATVQAFFSTRTGIDHLIHAGDASVNVTAAQVVQQQQSCCAFVPDLLS